jgi:hypothetical protein
MVSRLRSTRTVLGIGLVAGAAGLTACGPHPPPPPAPYHAIGTDSAWHLIIDDKNVTYIGAGQQPILQPRPQAIVGVAGNIYQTPRINVNTVNGPCVANGRTYPQSVQVTVDGVQHRGCGGL